MTDEESAADAALFASTLLVQCEARKGGAAPGAIMHIGLAMCLATLPDEEREKLLKQTLEQLPETVQRFRDIWLSMPWREKELDN